MTQDRMLPDRIDELYARGAARAEPVVSFEFFPPKSADADAQLASVAKSMVLKRTTANIPRLRKLPM